VIKKEVGNPATKRITCNNIVLKLKKYLSCIAIIAQIVTPFIIWRANTFYNTSNMIQLTNAIQNKTDAFYSAKLKGIEDEELIALTSFLNIYEFACQQYINKKIDKKAFKLFYDVMIEEIIKKSDEYNYKKELYPAIYQVYTEWYKTRTAD
jgi:hypothetical protein